MTECKYCCECIYYKKCVSNAPERIKCKSKDGSCVGFLAVCCEDFISYKSIDDIYEEQKRTESKNERNDCFVCPYVEYPQSCDDCGEVWCCTIQRNCVDCSLHDDCYPDGELPF
ncbi:MAG: hypothetical protein K2G14_02745 [Ruminococcus sp.]|nr:hypothetical protein [Ruminococcus sp.]